MTTWEGVVHQDTENIGRIWTDKTVADEDINLPASSEGREFTIAKGDSDFLIGLSALSSTSNITTASSVPLDIVLVLDTSTSMSSSMVTYGYNATYDVNTNGWTTYYAKNDDGTYAEIDRITSGWGPFQFFDHWELDGETVEPMTSESDTGSDRIQFYTRTTVSSQTRLEALQSAANNFIDSTAQQNAGIDDANRQHRVSIVSFSDDGTVRQQLTACTTENADSLKSTVDNLRANGNTYPGNAMSAAGQALQGARSDAHKVVIFFTDGNPAPSGTNDFDGGLANAGVQNSKSLKDEGALVYSVGVFDTANPDNTETSTSNQFNAYMHAMSSNYPDATAWNSLGERAKDSNYYKAATDADELNAIFQEISEEINKGSGFPTEVVEGAADTSGYITFTDELGAYMQVDEFKQLVFADAEFTAIPSVEGDTITYTYTGNSGGNALYPEGNVDDIIVQVKRSDDLAKGDRVTVKIPAGLIPLRDFKVKSDDAGITMEIAEAFPLRIFYGVSVKPGVADALRNATADQGLLDYIADNTNGGATSFYSNLYDGTVMSGGKALGNTTASFVPAESNTFYYFTENTTLYTDEGCLNALKDEPRSGETYYYKRSYYAMDSDTGDVTQKDSITRFMGANFEASTTFWGQATDGTYYIKAGAPRLTRVDDLTMSKTDNATGTSTEAINPNWDNINNPNVLNVSLGNNGKIDVELPGTLAIAKDARVAPNKGLSTDVLDGVSFKFEISIPSAAGKTLKAEVKDGQGVVTAGLFDLAFDAQGKATHSIKDDETLYIYGIDAGSDYAVSEDASSMPAGFTQTTAAGDTGTIGGNAVSEATFVNTYDVQSVTVGAEEFAAYAKTFDRWDIEGSFTIQLKEDNAENPMPEGSQNGADGLQEKNVQATEANKSGTFGDVTFDAAGTYAYTVMEKTPSTIVAGMTYSDAAYTVEVTVADNGKGALEATSKMLKTSDDAGSQVDPYEEVPNKTATFVNSFAVDAVSAGPLATKAYVNNGGADKNLADGMFRFKVRAVGSNAASAPMPAGASPDGDGYIYVVNDGPSVAFGQATFTAEHVGQTFTYEIGEVLPDGATADNGYTIDGMTYDPTAYIATFTVTSEAVDAENRVKVDVSYAKRGETAPIAGIPEFKNSYDPKDAVLEGAVAIKVVKTLNGRDSLDGESFGFTLTARGNATQAALESDAIVLGGDKSATELKTSVDELSDGQAKDGSFGSIKFAKPGVYTFNVVEDCPADGSGMVYDKHTVTATVTVTDENGALEAAVSYSGGGNAAAFVNTYAAQAVYSADMNITVGKTLTGRAQAAGEFGFSFAGVASGTVSADVAEARLAASDKGFTTIADAPSGAQSQMFNLLGGLTFTQDDAGKTFSYRLSETAGSLSGVTYDKTSYRLDIAVVDDGDGAMHTVTTISKNTAAGATEPIGTYDGADGLARVTLGFANTYAAASVEVSVPADQALAKVLTGRDWAEGDSFKFTLAAHGGAPEPAHTTAVAAMPAGTQDGTEVPFDFGTFTLDAAGLYHYTVTEDNGGQTIDGVAYDSHTADIYINVTDPGDGQLKATVAVNNRTFANVYKAELNHNDAGGIVVTKTTNGHDMTQGQFTFRVETLDGTGTTAVDTARRIGIEDGTTGDFGNIAGASGEKVEMPSEHPITFTHEDAGKTFKLKISEQGADDGFGSGGTDGGYTYSDAVYTVEMSVADDGKGELVLTTKVTDEDGSETTQTSSAVDKHTTYLDFVNVYESGSVDVDVAGGVQVVKTMTGRAIAAGDFAFTMTPVNDDAKDKFGADAKTAETAGAVLGNAGDANMATETVKLSTGMTFTQEDVGKSFVFEVAEKDGGSKGYTYDSALHELVFSVDIDGSTGMLAVEAKLDGALAATWSGTTSREDNVVSVPFANSYDAGSVVVGGKDGVALEATKVLTGRAMVEGEFRFDVVNAADASGNPAVVATGTNAADGTVAFSGMTYTTEQLNRDVAAGLATVDRSGDVDVYSYVYTATEDAAALDEGVSVVAGTQTFTVKVTDDREGALKAEVVYPDDGMVFENAYGAGSTARLSLGGVKVLSVESGSDAPDIAGKFQFAIAGSEGAPMPGKAAATNDAAGNVSFGEVVYSLDCLEGADPAPDGTRTKTFAYTVTESGNVPGVTNDSEAKTIEVTVTDNGDGTLSASKSTAGAVADFTFTNVYRAGEQPGLPAGKGSLTVKKVLTGRDLRDGEFSFKLENTDTGEVLTAVNDAAGNVSFPEIVFDQTGVFSYKLTEVEGEAGGVTYDATCYDVTATVVDNGSGTLDVTWTVSKDGAVVDGEAVAFENFYKAEPASIAFNAAKVLSGRDIVEGEFAFELRDAGGTLLQTATNGAAASDGSAPVSFDAVVFEEPGEYDYRIVEVQGSAEGVTYDSTVFAYHVVVTDDSNGRLEVAWTEGETGAPVFHNSYSASEPSLDPLAPDNRNPSDPDGAQPSGSAFAKTSDGMGVVLVGAVAMAFASVVVIGFGIRRMRRR